MKHALKALGLSAALAVPALGASIPAQGQVQAQTQEVKIGVAAEPYPPFTTPDASGRWVGWEIEVMNEICAREQLNCVLTPVSWDGIIPSLTSRKIDAIMSSLSITDERRKTIDFSDKYYNTPASVIGPKDVAFGATPEDLAGKVLGVQVSTVHADYARKHFTDAAEIKEYQTQDEANADLAAGRLDAVQADWLTLDAFLKSEQGKACCDRKGDVAPDPAILGPGIGVGLRKEDTALKEKFNAGIKSIRADGTYDAISRKYFSFDIYGAAPQVN